MHDDESVKPEQAAKPHPAEPGEAEQGQPDRAQTAEAAARLPFAPPHLEHLGAWRALTLQQSIPIGPGD